MLKGLKKFQKQAKIGVQTSIAFKIIIEILSKILQQQLNIVRLPSALCLPAKLTIVSHNWDSNQNSVGWIRHLKYIWDVILSVSSMFKISIRLNTECTFNDVLRPILLEEYLGNRFFWLMVSSGICSKNHKTIGAQY